jgi:hypothetical protein
MKTVVVLLTLLVPTAIGFIVGGLELSIQGLALGAITGVISCVR